MYISTAVSQLSSCTLGSNNTRCLTHFCCLYLARVLPRQQPSYLALVVRLTENSAAGEKRKFSFYFHLSVRQRQTHVAFPDITLQPTAQHHSQLCAAVIGTAHFDLEQAAALSRPQVLAAGYSQPPEEYHARSPHFSTPASHTTQANVEYVPGACSKASESA